MTDHPDDPKNLTTAELHSRLKTWRDAIRALHTNHKIANARIRELVREIIKRNVRRDEDDS